MYNFVGGKVILAYINSTFMLLLLHKNHSNKCHDTFIPIIKAVNIPVLTQDFHNTIHSNFLKAPNAKKKKQNPWVSIMFQAKKFYMK